VDLAIDAHLNAENVDSIEKLEEKMYEKIREMLEKIKKEAQNEK
jgi:hypothetical protein